MTIERDKRVVALREEGRTYDEIAKAVGLSRARVNTICRTLRPERDDPPIPEGLSVLTVRDTMSATGMWPSLETAPVIARRMPDILNRTHRRATIRELGAWLQALGWVP